MFMEIAVTAIGIGVVLMVGYLVIAQVKGSLISSVDPADTETLDAIEEAQGTVFSGFALVGIGIIVLAAFGLISVFK